MYCRSLANLERDDIDSECLLATIQNIDSQSMSSQTSVQSENSKNESIDSFTSSDSTRKRRSESDSNAFSSTSSGSSKQRQYERVSSPNCPQQQVTYGTSYSIENDPFNFDYIQHNAVQLSVGRQKRRSNASKRAKLSNVAQFYDSDDQVEDE